jgi:rod shape determining protein RodA
MASSDKQLNWSDYDRLTLTIYTSLVLIGWMMIYAVNYESDEPFAFMSLEHPAGKQLMFMIVCTALLFFLFLIDWTIWRTFAFFFYLFSLLLMIGTIFFGREINGANAWYQLGGFTFQPAELAKFATCLMMASYLSSPGVNLRETRSFSIAMGIFLLPVGIIILQKDTGSALVFFSFLLVLYREGLSPVWYIMGFSTAAVVILGLVFDPAQVASGLFLFVNYRLIDNFSERRRLWWTLWVLLFPLTYWWMPLCVWLLPLMGIDPAQVEYLNYFVLIPHLLLFAAAFLPSYFRKNQLVQRRLQLTGLLLGLACMLTVGANLAVNTLLAPHQRSRIYVWLRPTDPSVDARGSAYNLLHSKMAIGSGGFFGKGYLEGNMTKLKYVPEQSTDFIFCTVGEEQGFVGVLAIVALFTLLLYRITLLAERQRSNFSKLYAYCVAGILFVHVVVNIGMTMGLFPIIGIPLPFISYGGSSLIGFTLMMGVLLKLDSHRNSA